MVTNILESLNWLTVSFLSFYYLISFLMGETVQTILRVNQVEIITYYPHSLRFITERIMLNLKK